ncbi:MAG: acetyl-CoA hydrolase/transferase family protein, partial [Dehalococcoidia bacterium]
MERSILSTYTAEYEQKLTTPAKAVEVLKSGDTVIPGVACAEPPALLAAIADRARQGDLQNIRVYVLAAQKHAGATILSPDLCDCFQVYTWFVGPADRKLTGVGIDYFIPNYFHELPRIIEDYLKVDLTVSTVSPMDKNGFFSFGLSNDYTSTAARCAKKLVVEVNKNMPRVFGGSLLHISEVDAIVENDAPVIELPMPGPAPEDDAIGNCIAAMVPDGATIQIGAGAVPNMVTRYLSGHKDLGVHSEVLGAGIVDLVKKGVVTGKKKALHPMKHVFTLASGTRDTFDFMDDNPSMESYPVSYVNAPEVIALNDNMISINATLEVDLLGQCNSEFLGGMQFSGTGGQLDFVRGAFD